MSTLNVKPNICDTDPNNLTNDVKVWHSYERRNGSLIITKRGHDFRCRFHGLQWGTLVFTNFRWLYILFMVMVDFMNTYWAYNPNKESSTHNIRWAPFFLWFLKGEGIFPQTLRRMPILFWQLFQIITSTHIIPFVVAMLLCCFVHQRPIYLCFPISTFLSNPHGYF